jgi:hypothetical protein
MATWKGKGSGMQGMGMQCGTGWHRRQQSRRVAESILRQTNVIHLDNVSFRLGFMQPSTHPLCTPAEQTRRPTAMPMNIIADWTMFSKFMLQRRRCEHHTTIGSRA